MPISALSKSPEVTEHNSSRLPTHRVLPARSRKQGKANEQELASILAKNGQELLPMVDLIVLCQLACDEPIDVSGRTASQTKLQRSALA